MRTSRVHRARTVSRADGWEWCAAADSSSEVIRPECDGVPMEVPRAATPL